jgi:hypothetical protein
VKDSREEFGPRFASCGTESAARLNKRKQKMKAYENENWDDGYQDDIESQGTPLIRQGQSNSPKVLEGVLGIGDFLMPNGLVAKGGYQFLAIGCDNLWVHWAANRGGLLGFSPGSETPLSTEWLKPGVPRDGYPMAMKEGRYASDGSVWERTIYLHSLIVAVGKPAVHLAQPICGTFAFKGKSCEIGENFYSSQLKVVEAVIDGKVVRNMAFGLFEMSSEIERKRSYAWMAPKLILVGVFGQPGGPSIEQSWVAKTLRQSFKQGRAWASEPLPAIAAPAPTEAPQIPASELVTSKADIRAEPDASKSDPPRIPASKPGTAKADNRLEPGASTSDPPPIPPDSYDDDAGGPSRLDDVIFD